MIGLIFSIIFTIAFIIGAPWFIISIIIRDIKAPKKIRIPKESNFALSPSTSFLVAFFAAAAATSQFKK